MNSFVSVAIILSDERLSTLERTDVRSLSRRKEKWFDHRSRFTSRWRWSHRFWSFPQRRCRFGWQFPPNVVVVRSLSVVMRYRDIRPKTERIVSLHCHDRFISRFRILLQWFVSVNHDQLARLCLLPFSIIKIHIFIWFWTSFHWLNRFRKKLPSWFPSRRVQWILERPQILYYKPNLANLRMPLFVALCIFFIFFHLFKADLGLK